MAETAVISENMFGDKLYQQRARVALPLLVRQAIAGETIFYQDLASEMGMPNPRNLNYVLGSVGQTLIELGSTWQETIPPIQCLVVNQSDGMPGEGFGWFMPDRSEWARSTKRERAIRVDAVKASIRAYARWGDVLTALGLEPIRQDYQHLFNCASAFRSGGEGAAHAALKEFVRLNPHIVNVASRYGPGIDEKHLPSGDSIDVFFATPDEWVSAEVKPETSADEDICRGIFQCIKYEAVLKAMLAAEQRELAVRSVLVLGGTLPASLVPLKHTLGVTVIERVAPLPPLT